MVYTPKPVVEGLTSGDNVYIHYKREHFNWHRSNSDLYDFTGIEDRYRQITLSNYKKLAQKTKIAELDRIKKSPTEINDIIAAMATFSQENLDTSLNNIIANVGQELRTQANEILPVAAPMSSQNVNFNIDQKMKMLSNKIQKLDDLVSNIEKVNISLTDYLLQEENSSRKHIENLNSVLIDKQSLISLERIRTNLNSIKNGISKGKTGNFVVRYNGRVKDKLGVVSFALYAIQDDLYELSRSLSQSIGVAAANEAIQQLNGKKIGKVKMEVKKINNTFKNNGFNNVKVSYDGKNQGEISFNIPKAIKNNKINKVSLSSVPFPLKNYLHQVRWQARYLMFNGLMFRNYNLVKPFYQYIASKSIEKLVSNNTFGNNYIFLEATETLISISDFYQNIVNTMNFPSLTTSGSQSISNNWVGKAPKNNVRDDQDEIRPIYAWKRAKKINKVIQNLQTKIIFPQT